MNKAKGFYCNDSSNDCHFEIVTFREGEMIHN